MQHSSQLPSLQQDAVAATASNGATVKRGMAVGFTVETHGGTGELVKSGMIQGEILDETG